MIAGRATSVGVTRRSRSAALRRVLALGGVIGPAGFVTAWAVAGTRASSYSSVDDAISRLAAHSAPTQALMTAGFVLFGVGVPLFALALRAGLAGHAWLAAFVAGLCTLAVAALPLDTGVDSAHAVSAVIGYGALAATPLLAAGPLARDGRSSFAHASVVAGWTSALLLAASLLGPAHGLFQRAGLGATDIWICAMAIMLVTNRSDRDAAPGRRAGLRPPNAGRGTRG